MSLLTGPLINGKPVQFGSAKVQHRFRAKEVSKHPLFRLLHQSFSLHDTNMNCFYLTLLLFLVTQDYR